MPPYKAIIPAVVLSVAGHGILLGFVALYPLGTDHRGAAPDAIMVRLADAPETDRAESAPDREDTTAEGSLSTQSLPGKPSGDGYREDTIILGRKATPYEGYLTRLREKIDREWRYPPDADSRGGVRTVVVRFSISGRGDCTGALILSASGDHHLDRESLRAVQSAAPFEELPKEYNLNRLNVIAEFNYGAGD